MSNRIWLIAATSLVFSLAARSPGRTAGPYCLDLHPRRDHPQRAPWTYRRPHRLDLSYGDRFSYI
jgi:hypothetical protein